MGSFSAHLFFEGESEGLELQEVDTQFFRSLDIDNQPNSETRGGLIKVKLLNNNDNGLLDWALSQNMARNGYIRFSKMDRKGAKLYDYAFEQAYCIRFDEAFLEADDKSAVITDLTISPAKVVCRDVPLQKSWYQ